MEHVLLAGGGRVPARVPGQVRLYQLEAQAVGMTLWALGHGLASLTLDGQLALKAAAWGTDADDLLARALGQIGRSFDVGDPGAAAS